MAININNKQLEIAEKLAKILQAFYDSINDEYHPGFRDDFLSDQDRTLLVQARTVLKDWQDHK